ncbi:MAG: hypothetical protein H0U18_08020 [Pyrinomonadaceae bacterium]|nr:hypothetical protein [Pyrinomonadaceae bacterium]
MLLELHERANNGITVTLWYDAISKETLISLADITSELELQTYPVPAHRALEAFYHPYCFAPFPHIPKRERERETVNV